MKYVIALTGKKQDGTKSTYDSYPWFEGQLLLFMSEIENMKGHGVYCHNDKVYYGYHLHDFIDLDSNKYIDLFPDGLESVLVRKGDLYDIHKSFFILEEKNIKKIKEYEKKMYEDENNVVTHMFIHKNIVDLLEAPKMFAKQTETLEALFIYSIYLINSEFLYQELPLIKKKYNLLSTQNFSDVYKTFEEIIPVFKEILRELERYDDFV